MPGYKYGYGRFGEIDRELERFTIRVTPGSEKP
jgi:hypothetical protein